MTSKTRVLGGTNRSLVLASASRSRAAILRGAGMKFKTVRHFAKEAWRNSDDPAAVALRLAAEKAISAATMLPADAAVVVGADTIVAFGSRHGSRQVILGKPRNASDAFGMLSRASGTSQKVITGLFAIDLRRGRCAGGVEESVIVMKDLSIGEIRRYIRSGKWKGKAGAYAIRPKGDPFVASVRGNVDNVIGMPLALLARLLRRLGVVIARTKR